MLRRTYEWTMEKAGHPHAERYLFAIAFAESSFFPIPPHPLLGLMCLADPRRAVRYALITAVASVLGGLLGYGIGYFLYESVGGAILSALGLADSFPRAACTLRHYGAEIILIKGATPIPFKLIAITAGFIRLDLWTFVWASVVSRGAVFLVIGMLFRLFGPPIKAFIDRYLGIATAAFLLVLVGGFFLFGALSGHSGADECSVAPRANAGP